VSPVPSTPKLSQLPPTPFELTELLASMPADTVLGPHTSGQLWGLWLPRFEGVEVCTPAGANGSSRTTAVQRLAVTSHRFRMPDGAVVNRGGLPILTVEYTWLYLARPLGIPDLIAAGDSALRCGATMASLTAAVDSAPNLPGIRKARLALKHLDADSRSRPESRVRAAIVLVGLPKPTVNKAIHDAHGGWLAEPDLHYKEGRIALEYNGVGAHEGRTEADAVRMIDIQRAGWETRVYTTPFAFQRLSEVPVEVHALLRARAPQLLTKRLRDRQAAFAYDRRRRISRG